ncbi:NAD(P)H-quinone oxidoreductase [Basilea psittacipulmonis]|uniref:NAD(P)H-quinone oxidoreductase n=1 Tax=Basilea psittacipulmonis DSM 24701 TaxID=1072685 RepID=A0A077DG00_9BURK|nr:NAD(P)H-quinone oxidoreductase [Basilea psittacipulmonis]AIL32347.1 NAD(P)H-quinone oxidoreductase [Basilea psittacipulmonis DSM 24701]
MKAIVMETTGTPEVLKIGQIDKPIPKKNEVLIQVVACGVNRPDVLQRAGSYPPPKDASPILGLEVSGVIVEGDLSGTDFKYGDKVFALVPGGGYAEYCTVPASHCLPVPENLSMIEASAIAETAYTVWSNVFDIGHLSKGETLLVHGGASGIGTMAIQIAVALGYKVLTTVGSQEKLEAVERLGAIGINYKTDDFVAFVKEQGGADVILDMVCGDYIERNTQCANMDARIVIIAQLGGQQSTVNMARVMMKRLTITGSTLRPRTHEYKAYLTQQVKTHVLPLIEKGLVKPIVHQVYPLEQASQAHRDLEASSVIGKIVLTL